MNADSPAQSCSYCGRPNPDKLSACGECGTPLVSAPPQRPANEPRRKSKATAVALALVFGPLGLIYVGGWWQAFIMILIAMPFIVTHKGGLWLIIGGRIVAAAWAYDLAVAHDDVQNPQEAAQRLLDEAACLENVDFNKAISAYEDVIRQYPDTRAGKQATAAVEILKRKV